MQNSNVKNAPKSKKENAPVKKINNGEGVKAAFEKAIRNLPEKLDKLWATEGGKKYISHLMYSFLPMNRKEVFPIGKFEDHSKFNEIPKLCTLTGFAVADSNFKMDEVTKKYFESKERKVNKLVHAIPCVGSIESNKIISFDAMSALNEWVKTNLQKELNQKDKTFHNIMTSIRNKMEGKTTTNVDATKKMRFDNPKSATQTLGDKYDWDSLKSKFTEKGEK